MLPKFTTDSMLPELLAIAALVILPWIGIGIAVQHEYRGAEEAAEHSTGHLARALEESTRHTIGQIDSVLRSARALKAVQGERFDFDAWARTQADKMAAQIAMADPAGLVTGSTIPLKPGINISDRAHFRAQVDTANDRLYISKPVIGRVSGQQTIQFSRRLIDPDGGFGGVVVLSLGSSEMARFYESLGLDDGFVAILSTDGTILARGPRAEGVTGSNIAGQPGMQRALDRPSGSIQLLDGPDEVPRIASFRRLEDYPVIVMVGLTSDAVFKRYASLRNSALSGGAAISLAVGLIGFFWLRQKRRFLRSRRALTITLDTISQGILMVDGKGSVSVINPRALGMLAAAVEAPGDVLQFAASRAIQLMPSSDPGSDRYAGAAPGPAPDGTPRNSTRETTGENGAIIEVRTHVLAEGGFVQTYTDVSEQRMAHARAQHVAHHDALTGLANRVELRQRLSDIIGRTPMGRETTGVVMIDLDGFKGVNDTLGHAAGDGLLVEAGRRLKAMVRDIDVVARLGGDEFVILAAGVREREDVAPLARRVLRRLAEPFQVHGQSVRIGASLGIAFFPKDGKDVDTLLKHADIALHSAKTGGRGIYRCFDEQLTQAMTEQRLLENDLRRAIDDDALEVYFQPKFASRKMQIVGFEALARWRHPTRGFIRPDIFIPIAEDCGLINRLGRRILEQACKGVATWEPRVPVAVNVSVMQLRDGGLKDAIATVLEQSGLLPEHLEIEVTESVLADDDRTVLENLQAIKAMGIRIALDDFGTGYSSLSYLRRFRFDKIKIDRTFVQGQAGDPGVRVILEAILGMCRNLGLATVGEGVETEEQLAMLRERGCNEIQGYLLGRPMPGAQVQDFIWSNGPSRHAPELEVLSAI